MRQASYHHDLMIRGGTVIDGTCAPRFEADIGISAGRIAAIGDLSAHTADQVLDARGRIVAPGFIDAHTHDDQAVLSQADMGFKISPGVTTVVAGVRTHACVAWRDGQHTGARSSQVPTRAPMATGPA